MEIIVKTFSRAEQIFAGEISSLFFLFFPVLMFFISHSMELH